MVTIGDVSFAMGEYRILLAMKSDVTRGIRTPIAFVVVAIIALMVPKLTFLYTSAYAEAGDDVRLVGVVGASVGVHMVLQAFVVVPPLFSKGAVELYLFLCLCCRCTKKS